jgi:hypothetical protein
MTCAVLFLLLSQPGEEELPPLADLTRFPPLAVVRGRVEFLDRLNAGMLQLQIERPADAAEYEVLRTEATRNRTDWVFLKIAIDEEFTPLQRREYLWRLKQRIGYVHYCAGYIEPAPVQYFKLK